jgi:putative two-component system response regulator
MSVYAWIIALNLGLSDERAELIRFAAPMHDIGKLGVRDAVLLKPGRLDPDERAEMERHAEMGAEILAGSQAEVIQTSSLIALTHHEKWDGTGYPRRLKCDDTAIEGRIVGLADAFDCISSRRVYKEATPFDEAVEVVKRDSGTHFDPACVGAFVRGGDAVRATYDSMNDEASLDLSALSLRELLHSPGSSSG